MYFVRRAFDLAVCLLSYWIGKGYGGWGGGIVLAFAGLCATSFGWEYLARNVLAREEKLSVMRNFIYGMASTVLVAAAAYILWGK